MAKWSGVPHCYQMRDALAVCAEGNGLIVERDVVLVSSEGGTELKVDLLIWRPKPLVGFRAMCVLDSIDLPLGELQLLLAPHEFGFSLLEKSARKEMSAVQAASILREWSVL